MLKHLPGTTWIIDRSAHDLAFRPNVGYARKFIHLRECRELELLGIGVTTMHIMKKRSTQTKASDEWKVLIDAFDIKPGLYSTVEIEIPVSFELSSDEMVESHVLENWNVYYKDVMEKI